jgi:hypothetical protein
MDESSSVVIYDMAKVRAVRILNVRGTGIGAAGDGVEATSALAMAAMAKRASEAAALATSALNKRASEAVALVTLDASSHAAPKSAGAEPPVAHQLPCGGAAAATALATPTSKPKASDDDAESVNSLEKAAGKKKPMKCDEMMLH